MNQIARLRLADVEQRVCDIASEELGICRDAIWPDSAILEDLHCDSLDMVELFMEVEEAFQVTLPDQAADPVTKAVFTRQPFRLADLAELVYLRQGTGAPKRTTWRQPSVPSQPAPALPFTHLDGRWQKSMANGQPLLEPLHNGGPTKQFRRRSDGLRRLLLPSAEVEIGCDLPDACPDERPKHVVELDSFLIDAEPVSTTAYCRFLNSIGELGPELLSDWFVLDPEDDRVQHMLIERSGSEWQPLPGSERWPMILVSWYGANAFSLWANGKSWTNYRGESGFAAYSFLPSEAQWEYAARGARYRSFPWGEAQPSSDHMVFGRHRKGASNSADTLPMANVNAPLGMSPFGLHHMAGNVWQWCRDWYDETFYQRPQARDSNRVNETRSRVRSERGGSWIGPADLCRSSYRRGRPPHARGRCLGFRCISSVKDVP
jgi:acyl carrier protein